MKTFLFLAWILICTACTWAQHDLQARLAGVPVMEFPRVDSISYEETPNACTLNEKDWARCKFDSLEIYQSDFQYAIIGQKTFHNLSLLLVARNYEEENVHWLCLMSSDFQLVDWIQTAYENSEGFLIKQAKIEEERIVVMEWNEFAEVQEKKVTFHLTEDGFRKL